MVRSKRIASRQLAEAIVSANQAALDSCGCPLVNVIISSHGTFGSIYIGGVKKENGQYEHPMEEDDLGVFGILKPLNIATIWLGSLGRVPRCFGCVAQQFGQSSFRPAASKKPPNLQPQNQFRGSLHSLDVNVNVAVHDSAMPTAIDPTFSCPD
jgi:hypothetical protein